MLVYVINKHGQPLMPCKPRKARLLLKSGKAKVIERTPFTIQLVYGSSGYRQPVKVRLDTGAKHVGVAAVRTDREGKARETLFQGECQLRTNIRSKMDQRRNCRRTRRNRKTRYRMPRFDNRRLITLCEDCHRKIHSGEISLTANPGRTNFRYAAHTQAGKTVLMVALRERLPILETTGAVTKVDRLDMGLLKTHANDALAIAASGIPIRLRGFVYLRSRHHYSRKGGWPVPPRNEV